jgi:hypothetical protein
VHPRQFELNGVIVDDEQPSSFTVGHSGRTGQVGANGINQATGFDRLDEQGRKPILVGLRLCEAAQESGQRQDRQLKAPWKRTQAAKELESIHVRQNEVLENEVRQGIPCRDQGRASVRSLDYGVALGDEGKTQHLARRRIVLDDENGWPGTHG